MDLFNSSDLSTDILQPPGSQINTLTDTVCSRRSFLGRVMKGSTGESPRQLSDPVQPLYLCTQLSQ